MRRNRALWSVLTLFSAISAIANDNEGAFVTFIVASYGRWTLEWTLKSLINQTDVSWRAIVALDGALAEGSPAYISHAPAYLTLPKTILTDKRIDFLMLPITGSYQFSGSVRNAAFEYVKSPWVGFVDDDDTVAPDYVSLLRAESSRSESIDGVKMADIGAVVFRAKHQITGYILPAVSETGLRHLAHTDSAISFSFRSNLDARFSNGCSEHYEILRDIVKKTPLLLSSHTTYFIRGKPEAGLQLDARLADRVSPLSSSLVKGEEAILRTLDPVKMPCKIAKGNEKVGKIQISSTPYTIAERLEFKDKSGATVDFVFPNGDSNSIFFHDNVMGLKSSIENALKRGCLNSWTHGNLDVDVLFDAHAKTSSKYYIQFNMEQVGNARLFNDAYINKLKRATAVWDWSRENIHNINKFLSDGQLSMVPLWLAMLSPMNEKYKCRGVETAIVGPDVLCPKIYTYRYNRMVPCQIGQCTSLAADRAVERSCPATDVPFALFFGYMSPHRLEVCRLLTAKLPHRNIYCIDDTFGVALLKYKCAAEVVFIMHNFHKASLEVHRVNPLIAIGKKVVSMASNDPALDYLYSSNVGVRFADTFSELAVQVDAAMEQVGSDKRQLQFIRSMNVDSTPICAAIRSLDMQVTAHKKAKFPEDKAFDKQKTASRRRRNNVRKQTRRQKRRKTINVRGLIHQAGEES